MDKSTKSLTFALAILVFCALSLLGSGCDTDEALPCVGMAPPASAYDAKPGPVIGTAGGGGGGGSQDGGGSGGDGGGGGAGGSAAQFEPTEVGAPLPVYQLQDFQPRSCGFGATYGLQVAEQDVVVVALLAGWCSYCQSQAFYLEEMRQELQAAGHAVRFYAVNKRDAVDAQNNLTERCAFPLLQDLPEVNVWDRHHAGLKDDIYVYGSDGTLSALLRMSDTVNTNLSTGVGYQTVKSAIASAL